MLTAVLKIWKKSNKVTTRFNYNLINLSGISKIF